MDWQSLRRVITGEDAKGRSKVLIDGEAAKLLAMEEAGLAEIWAASFAPGKLLDATDRLAESALKLEPDPGSVKVRWFTIPPEDENVSPEEKEAAAAMAFEAVQASHCRYDTTLHPTMHKTNSLDVIILIHGEIDLLLDDGEASSLKAGDVVIQRATNHTWINRSGDTALFVAVLIHAD